MVGESRILLPGYFDVLELEVSILDIEPRIWRRLLVPARASLAVVHEALQFAFGWMDCHLHSFDSGEVQFKLPHPEDELFAVDERGAPLGAFVRAPLVYEYDFGDCWRHEIVTLGIAEGAKNEITCTEGARAAPPEDSGGVGGYAELLVVLADPEHEEYEHMRAWAGKRFDPEAFDRVAINRRLAKLTKLLPRLPKVRAVRR
jgi:hypothetical protein